MLTARKNASPEYSVQVTLFRYLKAVLPDALIYAIENAAQPKSDNPNSRMAFHAKRRAKGVLNGVPDLCAILPGPTLIFVEAKAPGGTVSVEQQRIHAELLARHAIVIVSDSVESLRAGLIKAGIRLREAPGQPVAAAKVRYDRRVPIDNEVPF